jgi:UDP-N-acetylglucosamine 2-epimerase (non-hydrolysing)
LTARVKKIISVVGARPNFMKLAPIENQLRRYRKYISHKIVHTGQHYDYSLSKIFFKDLKLPKPDVYLGAGSSSHAKQTADIMIAFEQVLLKEKPDLVIVYGDVNSTLACSLVCSKIQIRSSTLLPVAHVEAGLRSFDRTMPEEINRIITDVLSRYLFVTEKAGVANLLNEGIEKSRIHLVGDVLVDSLVTYQKEFNRSDILNKLNVQHGDYIIMTLHRPANVDNIQNLKKIVSLLESISHYLDHTKSSLRIVFPIHPRTQKMASSFGLQTRIKKIPNLILSEPQGYNAFIKLLMESRLVLTDSGSIQEEATFLRIPCLTLRDSFERPETITTGTNTLCKLDKDKVMGLIRQVFEGKYKKGKVPKLMDGEASKRITKILVDSILG